MRALAIGLPDEVDLGEVRDELARVRGDGLAVDEAPVLADDDEVVALHEEVELVEVDFLLGVEVERGLEDDEEHITVSVDLRALIGVEEVLDEERVEVPRGRDLRQRLRSRMRDDDLRDRSGLRGTVGRALASASAKLVDTDTFCGSLSTI